MALVVVVVGSTTKNRNTTTNQKKNEMLLVWGMDLLAKKYMWLVRVLFPSLSFSCLFGHNDILWM
jgi:hypothetical protein